MIGNWKFFITGAAAPPLSEPAQAPSLPECHNIHAHCRQRGSERQTGSWVLGRRLIALFPTPIPGQAIEVDNLGRKRVG